MLDIIKNFYFIQALIKMYA